MSSSRHKPLLEQRIPNLNEGPKSYGNSAYHKDHLRTTGISGVGQGDLVIAYESQAATTRGSLISANVSHNVAQHLKLGNKSYIKPINTKKSLKQSLKSCYCRPVDYILAVCVILSLSKSDKAAPLYNAPPRLPD